jgi:hypothetical protein
LTHDSLDEASKKEELAYQEFVEQQGVFGDNLNRIWFLPPVLMQLTLTFLAVGVRKNQINNIAVLIHFLINVTVLCFALGLMLHLDTVWITLFSIAVIIVINVLTIKAGDRISDARRSPGFLVTDNELVDSQTNRPEEKWVNSKTVDGALKFLGILLIVFLSQVPGCVVVLGDDAGQISYFDHKTLIEASKFTFALPLRLITDSDSDSGLLAIYLGNLVLLATIIFLISYALRFLRYQSSRK